MRSEIIEYLKREIVGPDPNPALVQEDGEEILLADPPRKRYGAGILFPMEALLEKSEEVNDNEAQVLSENGPNIPDDMLENVEKDSDINVKSGYGSEMEEGANDDIVNLTNSLLPSAIGFTCNLMTPSDGIRVLIKAAKYVSGDYAITDGDGNTYLKKAYFRKKMDTEFDLTLDKLPLKPHSKCEYPVKRDGNETGLTLHIQNRSHMGSDNSGTLMTFTLINRIQSDHGKSSSDDCFYQVELEIKDIEGQPIFLPYPKRKFGGLTDDERSNDLLYRNHHTFAIGHGCAAEWDSVNESESVAVAIRTSIIPVYDMKPVVPAKLGHIDLSMLNMSDASYNITDPLKQLCNSYAAWIEARQIEAYEQLSGELLETAKRHIDNCRQCLERMRNGIKLIEEDPQVKLAFGLMNRAMVMQQIHYGLKLRNWYEKDKTTAIDPLRKPDLWDRATWPDADNPRYGSWRPFQIAFILMNLVSMSVPESEDRKIVDIIWFPTGGGKTEAYLGLTAFTIFLRRLRNKNDSGTSVLMRYTLRLLTAQQYQRASSLICAIELIRKENAALLGNDRITIGLWVGDNLTPNKRADAIKHFNQLQKKEKTEDENPFIVLKCPWCGAQMGPVKVGKSTQIKGYRRMSDTVVFQCSDSECDFSKPEFTLPLMVIDDDIYENPPTLLIGTVDKFAMLPWRPEARGIFGYREDNDRVSPPDLIIQDELHLISGPLGSMVGHYETLVLELCKNTESGTYPKIIASTATISRAKEQAQALYACDKDKVFQFPPQCLDAGESFFATVDKEAHGRTYVGIHATALPSHVTTQVRVFASLLQAVSSITVTNERLRNPYWSLLCYFNSLRELGHAATLIRADISEYLNVIRLRKGIRKQDDRDPRRFINRSIELTSRIASGEISKALQFLEENYPSFNKDRAPVDICLATNMISVGLDVPRLGLMAVVGQPKTTSEYIQATSRVGRSKDAPGLVVVIYNPSKPRDRSHYEHFYSYHDSIYRYVEPTSVTPFSAPVRERALHAILVGMVRFMGNQLNRISPSPMPDASLFKKIKEIISNRVLCVDEDEHELTLKRIDELLEEWRRFQPSKYGDFAPPTAEAPLMYPAGSSPMDEWDDRAWATPSSMRNVDLSCEARVITEYPKEV
jgi:hypothetical protein